MFRFACEKHFRQTQHETSMALSSPSAVANINETLAIRISLLARDMERLGLNADAAILRGLMRSLPSQLLSSVETLAVAQVQ